MNQDSKDLECNSEVATEFLNILNPEGMHTLTAIWPHGVSGKQSGKPDIITKTFPPEERESCLRFIKAGNEAGWNMYALINPAHGKPSKKPKKEDIAEIRWIFVDIDPRAGEPLEEERQRILRLLTSSLPEEIPEPTLVVDSGSGYWAFWKLEQPIKL